MAERIVTRCPFCGKPHSVNLSTFESVATSPLMADPAVGGGGSSILSESLRVVTWVVLGTSAAVVAFWWSDWYNPPMWVSPVLGLTLATTLEAVRLWLHRPQLPVQQQAGGVVVRLEQVSEDNRHWLIEDFDTRLTLAHFQHVAEQVARGSAFTRSALCKPGVLSQQQYHVMRDDFVRLRFLVPLPQNANGYALTLRGRAFLRKVPTRHQ